MPAEACDVLFTGATVYDGSAAPPRQADVAVRNGRIAALGELGDWQARQRIDASGLALAPGFIDAHTHDDRAVLSGPDMRNKVSQGVTTVVAGNCGISLAPLAGKAPPPPLNLLGGEDWYRFATMAEYLDAVDAAPSTVNLVMLCGHSTLRVAVMNDLQRGATSTEIDRMGTLLDEAMQAGCVGMSTGLAYPTAIDAPTEEVIELTRRAADHGGLYATHMRNEVDQVVESVDETVRIGREAHARVVISHHKVCGRANWGRIGETLARIDAANHDGQVVDFDVYPYIASSTVLLKNFVDRAERVIITWSHAHPQLSGRDLADIAADWGCDVYTACDRLQPAGAVYFQMDEADLRRALAHPGAMVGSDGLPHDEKPHPRLWGTFPRVLGHYARDEGLFPLQVAIHKMTGLTARVFGLDGRGSIAAGQHADLVLFDPATVIDRADFEHPDRPSAGILRVMVNGQFVWQDGQVCDARPGRVLRRGQGG